MDPKEDYQAPAGTGKAVSEEAGEAEVQETRAEKKEQRPAEKKEPRKEAEKEYATEALLALGEGKIRLVLNYPLAVMVCFMVVVAVICAVLVGWKLGRDRTEKRYRELLLGQQEKIERKIPGMEPEDSADSLDR